MRPDDGPDGFQARTSAVLSHTPDVSTTVSASVSSREGCSHCGGPLPVDFLAAPSASGEPAQRYCCYGCRLLGERRPLPPGAGPVREPAAGNPWFRIGVGVALASQAMLLGFAVNLTPPEGRLRGLLHGLLAGSAAVVFVLLGGPMLRAAWECACRRRVTVELLFLTGIAGAFGASVWSTFTGIGAVYYEVVAVLLVVYAAGKALTARARERAVAESRRLRDTFDHCRRLLGDGSTRMVPVAVIEPGDRIRIDPGEPVPVDGRIVEGSSFVRETPLTGEPFPVVRRPGDAVLAGSWAEDGGLLIAATTQGRRRRLDELLLLVETTRQEAAGAAGQTADAAGALPLADRITRWFLPLVLAVAGITFGVWTARGHWSEGLFHALAVLLVACPCALGLATPLGLWNVLATLAARGFIVTSGEALERLARADHVIFDKTGTLTEDRQSLVDFVTRVPEERGAWLEVVRAVQQRSRHPVARAFVSAPIPERGVPPVLVQSVKVVPAAGIEAWVRQDRRELHVRIGHPDWIGHAAAREVLEAQLRGGSDDPRVALEVDGQLVGLAQVRERSRTSAAPALAWLRNLGCRVGVLTGDQPGRAQQVLESATAGTPEAASGVEIAGAQTPMDKAHHVVAARAAGDTVVFVGDGINDAPALKSASVGVALVHGAPLASASADALLCGEDLTEIPRAIQLTRRVRDAIRSNLLFAAFYNALGMGLAATGHLHPITAALLMVGSSTIVSWRAVRSGRDADCHPEPSPARRSNGLRAWLVPACCALQVPWVIHLGSLGGLTACLATATLLGLGALFAWLERPRFSAPGFARGRWAVPGLRMAGAMIGPGNLGMLLGWWVDAGFGPVMRDGVCLCCRSHDYFSMSGGVPWMSVGMLLGGLPPMWRATAALPGILPRPALLGLSAMGMIVGMGWGGDLALGWAGPGHPQQFLVACAGMTLGMLAGMFFACAAGAAALAARQ